MAANNVSTDIVSTDSVAARVGATDALDYEPTLGELLAERASAMSLGSLFAQAAGGATLTIVFAWLQPQYWPTLVCASIASAMHGLWGYTLMSASPTNQKHLRVSARTNNFLRSASSLIGITAAFAFLVSILFVALGRWIS